MKTEKEYPATHSMSTAWYVVDEDGNVGIMKYGENGPVPHGTGEHDAFLLPFGYRNFPDYDTFFHIALTDVQLADFKKMAHDAAADEKDCDPCLIWIDVEKTKDFQELTRFHDDVICLSEEQGLYLVDYNDIYFNSLLEEAIEKKVILKVYSDPRQVQDSPYFLFAQPEDSTEELPQKLHTPAHPVKLEQLPSKIKDSIPRIPGKFAEMDTFQIAEHYRCRAYCDGTAYRVSMAVYEPYPLPDRGMAYLLTNRVGLSKIPFCFGQDRDNCAKRGDCPGRMCYIREESFTDEPTILLLTRYYNHYLTLPEEILSKAYTTSYIPARPRKKVQQSVSSAHEADGGQPQQLCYLEKLLADINPRVVIVQKAAYNVIEQLYTLHPHLLTVHGVDYPIYLTSEIKSNRKDIFALAKMPYQGRLYPRVIEVSKMKRLVETGEATVYEPWA